MWAAPHHPSSTQGVQLLSDLQKQDDKTEVGGVFLMLHGDEPAGCCLRDKDTPVALRSFHTWPEASYGQRLGVVKGLDRDTGT